MWIVKIVIFQNFMTALIAPGNPNLLGDESIIDPLVVNNTVDSLHNKSFKRSTWVHRRRPSVFPLKNKGGLDVQ